MFPIYSPRVDSIEVIRRGDVRRAKLYYMRELSGKAARIKEKRDFTTANDSAPKKESKAKAETAKAEAKPAKAKAKTEEKKS